MYLAVRKCSVKRSGLVLYCSLQLVLCGCTADTEHADRAASKIVPRPEARSAPAPLEQVFAEVTAEFERAEQVGYLWLDTREHLQAARAHADAGRSSEARAELALVSQQVSSAINQSKLERARYLLSELERGGFDGAERDAIAATIRAADGDTALVLVQAAHQSATGHVRAEGDE